MMPHDRTICFTGPVWDRHERCFLWLQLVASSTGHETFWQSHVVDMLLISRVFCGRMNLVLLTPTCYE